MVTVVCPMPARGEVTKLSPVPPRWESSSVAHVDLLVILQDRPGELARLGTVAGDAGVNIRGLAAFTGEGAGVVHLLLDDVAAPRCRNALQAAGIGVADERRVLLIDIEDRPGSLGEVMRRLGDAGVNVELAYTTFGGVRLVIATDDIHSAAAALEL